MPTTNKRQPRQSAEHAAAARTSTDTIAEAPEPEAAQAPPVPPPASAPTPGTGCPCPAGSTRPAAAGAAGEARGAPRPGIEHHRAEGHVDPEAHPDSQGPERRRRHRHAEAGSDFPDPQGPDRAERLHLFGRRPGSAARRLRVPARAGLQLPAGSRRHLRLPFADSQVRPADGRHGVRPDPAAQGRGALLRPDQGRGGQLRGARPGARQAVLREPDAALSAGAVRARDARRRTCPHASWT